jgi:hypothetical protein
MDRSTSARCESASLQRARLERVSIGRALNQDVVLRHPRVSKFHAFFITKANDWSIADAGSTNGTTVNGVRLAPRRPALLRSGDQVAFGPIQTAFSKRPWYGDCCAQSDALVAVAKCHIPILEKSEGDLPERSLVELRT